MERGRQEGEWERSGGPTETGEQADKAAGWADVEWGAAALGDARLTARLVQLATAVGAQPSASLPQACGSDPGTVKAAYRFLSNDAVTPVALLDSHVQATYGRIGQRDGQRDEQRSVARVLALQDTTYLSLTSHRAMEGRGPLRSVAQQGLLAHTTLAVTPERVPLGVLAQEVWARDPETYAQQADHKTRPIAQKESHKWLTSLAAVAQAREACPATHFISVGDREADVYDLFLLERPAGVDLLVRAAWDRALEPPEPQVPQEPSSRRLRATLMRAPVLAPVVVAVPRRPAQGKRPAQPAREATLTVRAHPVTLRPPTHRASEGLPSVPVWAVLAREETPPAGGTGGPPLDWLLLTTCAVHTADDALERVAWYAGRWTIEVLHKVLKSGCRIEQRQLATAERLERCLALYTVVAWRVLYATLLARAVPAAPCTVLLEPDEWQALFCHIHRTTLLPPAPPPLREPVRWLGHLGGFLGRARDADPGPAALWRGVQRLHDLTDMYRLFRPPPSPPFCG